MFIRHRIKWVVAALLGAVLFTPPWARIGTEGRAEIQEHTIRWLYDRYAARGTRNGESCFIGLGGSFGANAGDIEMMDPDPAFMARFADFPPGVLPVSKLTAEEYPPPLMDIEHHRNRWFPIVVGAGNISKLSYWIVSCRGYYYESPYHCGAYNVYLVRSPTGWKPFFRIVLWTS